ncbi:hypothetical protein SO802_011681 [Lithocarpus litseifolius]|uniref:Uncharacterized protein n=1 Tax=Lithocarpus litseifolius TaxID=425828 RepID=A0AAW2D4T8_9ROSI
MTMAVYPSILTQTNLFSPAKPKPLSSTSKPLFLRTPCLILRLHSPTPSSSTFSAKPISQISLTTSLRASPPQKYVYPDPIPEFAEAEIRKFRAEVLRNLLKDKDTFGDELDAVVDVCAEIFGEFLHKEYGGPGTLLVEPFTNMLVALNEKRLPGAPLAARASLLWAQNYVDQDWEVWNSKLLNDSSS